MTWAVAGLIVVLMGVLTLSSYVTGVYAERGKLLSREFQENIDAWEELAEPRLGMSRERVQLAAAVTAELSLGCLALVFGAIAFAGARRPDLGEVVQAVLALVLVVLLFHRLLPYVFFTRTRGQWIAGWVWVLRILFWVVSPVTVALGFLLSVASLAEPPEAEEPESASEGVEALIEAGREEGILEESDSELVRSAVEFGDKVVRELMTPRPSIFAVPATMTIAAFTEALAEKPFSRVPVYRGSLDHISGIAFAHDVLQIRDTDAESRRVGDIQRPAFFVPETKAVNELLKEMQRDKQHMEIVIDEYGSVAGLVTIEDLLEEIVGVITDEHETDGETLPEPDANDEYVLDGGFEVSKVEDLWHGEGPRVEEARSATTIGGLVSEAAGRIPLAGEVVEADGLRIEVLAATGRRVEQVRISRVAPTEGKEQARA
jgi:putative hemolysin